jgi:hypothetical protein
MKHAAIPQKNNPNKPTNVDDWAIWQQIEFDGSNSTALQEAGWFISDVDNFAQWFQLKKVCPKSITPRQARQALIISGIGPEQIVTALNTLPSPTKELALAEWEYSTEFFRDRPIVKSVSTMLGWSEMQLDELFIYAGSLG